jgi:hypothetical protein
MHEKLTEEHGIAIGYSTLTRLVHEQGIGKAADKPSAHVPDVPGEEMQHDTTVYTLKIGGVKRRIICSGLYLRYSKMRYIRFFPRFNRFVMKCFIDEALKFWGYSAHVCIIDNTNLAILYGSGSSAVMHPEMVAFARNYGYIWVAHALGHANRKAGKERNFYTVETNFLPGREFGSLDDLNEQALQWATVRYAQRPQSHTKLIPLELFELEKTSLIKLPEYISSPYLPFKRKIDEYGYVVVDVNYYWVPRTVVHPWVTVLRYARSIRIMDGTTEVARYPLPAENVRNERFVPEGIDQRPRGEPHNRKQGCVNEERLLREMEPIVGDYLDFILSPAAPLKHKHAFIRGLYVLSHQLGSPLFIQTIRRVLQYRVTDLGVVHRTAKHLLKATIGEKPLCFESTGDYQQRQAYLAGRFAQENPFDCPIES